MDNSISSLKSILNYGRFEYCKHIRIRIGTFWGQDNSCCQYRLRPNQFLVLLVIERIAPSALLSRLLISLPCLINRLEFFCEFAQRQPGDSYQTAP